MQDKRVIVDETVEKLKRVMLSAVERNYEEQALAAISVGCRILYQFNQKYTDDDFEEGVLATARLLKARHQKELERFQPQRNTVLFYDGFGLDNRGVAKMYLHALVKNGYRVTYATCKLAKGKLPETEAILNRAGAQIQYFTSTDSYRTWAEELLAIVLSAGAGAMFFYTTPDDAAGAAVFAVMEGLADRFLIDLTDHAFWLGTKCNDYFCGSREMSASNQVYERKLPREKLIKLGVNLMITEDNTDHGGLPFDVTRTRYIFSGGQLYKTLGEENHYYYRIVDHLLSNHGDVKFLYAGSGDRREMDRILQKFPDRAFLIPEREDFYYLIRHCLLYLNTYPMFGGMMMKYAANAGKLPITLKHDNDSDGLLLDQASRRIEYDTWEELVGDADRLLEDEAYLAQRESLLEGSVITEERFVNNVRMTIEEHHTDYEHGKERIDTERFKKEFYDRFDMEEVREQVALRLNHSLFFVCPWMIPMMLRRKILRMQR